MPPRQAQLRHSRQESRDRIVAAATELVRDRSYNELSIAEVMERRLPKSVERQGSLLLGRLNASLDWQTVH